MISYDFPIIGILGPISLLDPPNCVFPRSRKCCETELGADILLVYGTTNTVYGTTNADAMVGICMLKGDSDI